MVKDALLPIKEDKTVVAYALSKQTVSNEMGDFDKYNQMNVTEFYEYLARLAALHYDEIQPLAIKLQRLLGFLLPLVKSEFKPPDLDFDIESESDYDEDWVDQVIQETLTRLPDPVLEVPAKALPVEMAMAF